VYSIVIRVKVTTGRLAEFDAAADQFDAYAKNVPGMRAILRLQSRSYPNLFTVAFQMENVAALQAWARTPEFTAHVQQVPQALYTPVGDTEAWESVITSAAYTSQPGPIVAVAFTIKNTAGVQQGFEQTMREIVALFEKHARGLTACALSRLAGSSARYLLTFQYASEADIAATRAQPEIVRTYQEDPVRQYLAEDYVTTTAEIVRVAVGAAAAVR